ncbi:desulfoferrodoxin family protein [Candidatus Omnitrophota bacterium]
MNTFVCKVCGHIAFDAAPEKCPVCGAPKPSFENKPDAITQPADPANLTDGDKKHIPKILVVKECGLIPGGGCVDAHVKVGEIEHVMQPEHFIRYIDFYLDKKFISRTQLTPENVHPAAVAHLNATTGTVTVIENCNVHGSWIVEVEI